MPERNFMTIVIIIQIVKLVKMVVRVSEVKIGHYCKRVQRCKDHPGSSQTGSTCGVRSWNMACNIN